MREAAKFGGGTKTVGQNLPRAFNLIRTIIGFDKMLQDTLTFVSRGEG
jgi:hypothetical protein